MTSTEEILNGKLHSLCSGVFRSQSNIQDEAFCENSLQLKYRKPFLGKFDPKNENCQFKLKFATYIDSKMKNSKVMFIFSLFYRNYLFLEKFVPENQSCFLKLKFRTQTDSNLGFKVNFHFFFLFQVENTLFGLILVQKLKIASLS